jgi:tRNA threonylcarbamoyladenosine biosynthesis protein TsaE
VLTSVEDTEAAAAWLAGELVEGMVITLEGELGAGKTSFVRGALRALGVEGPVKSPTYGLMESYVTADFTVHHFDFYRLEHPLAWREAGAVEVFNNDNVVFIEWPSKAEGLPVPDLAITLTEAGEGRHMRVQAMSRSGLAVLLAWLPGRNDKG